MQPTPENSSASHKPLPSPKPHLTGSSRRWRSVLLIAVFLTLAGGSFVYWAQGAREETRKSNCRFYLKQIGIALHNYHDIYHAFPPAYTPDAEGRPLHSWRTLLIPYLEANTVYSRIDWTKPWNDPANIRYIDQTVWSYPCPSAILPPHHTTYLAIVTSKSVIQPSHSRSLPDITDGPANTMLVIEVDPEDSVPWMSPADADEEMIERILKSTAAPHRHALLCDGSVIEIRHLTAGELRAMISIDAADGVSSPIP